MTVENMENKEWKCKIGGSLHGIVPALVALFVFGGVALWLYLTNNGIFIFVGALAALSALLTVIGIYKALFVKFLIGDYDFYYQSAPAKGRCYKYSELAEVWLSRAQNGEYLNFKTHSGQVTKIFLLSGYDVDSADYFIDRFYTVNGIERAESDDDDE